MSETVRVMDKDHSWRHFACIVSEQTGVSCTLKVPELDGTWSIGLAGMVANIGGNDWRIYTLHPEDCARLCASTINAP